MRSSLQKALVCFAILLLPAPFVATAQIQSGTISGTVVDSSGGVVANAHVTITSDQTGATRSATTWRPPGCWPSTPTRSRPPTGPGVAPFRSAP